MGSYRRRGLKRDGVVWIRCAGLGAAAILKPRPISRRRLLMTGCLGHLVLIFVLGFGEFGVSVIRNVVNWRVMKACGTPRVSWATTPTGGALINMCRLNIMKLLPKGGVAQAILTAHDQAYSTNQTPHLTFGFGSQTTMSRTNA